MEINWCFRNHRGKENAWGCFSFEARKTPPQANSATAIPREPTNLHIRPSTSDDFPFLQEMLFEAAYWRPGQVRPSQAVGLARPDLIYLLADWGREGDTARIAVADQTPVGAAWYRFWGPEKHSYGYISPQIPELAIAVRGEYRGQGVGHKLLDALLETAASQGIEKISLSVEVENPALNLYFQHGFEAIQKNEGDWVMAAKTIRSG